MQKANWLSDEALQIAEKRSERQSIKGKIYVEFQRIARRDKKVSSVINAKQTNKQTNKQTKTEENNRMGKTRDLFKRIRDIKGTFHAKMCTIKDRSGKDLTKAEDIKKRWQEYTELYRKDLHDPDNHDGVIKLLEPDILECKVKWALGSP